MKKFLLFLLVLGSLQAQEQITILHWNDFHSQNIPFQVKTKNRATKTDTTYMVGGSAVLAAYLHKNYDSDSTTLVLNAGDDFQGSPVSTVTKGSSQIQLLNLLHPDAFEIGNHEFDYGRESLFDVLKQAHFPVLAANLYDTQTGKPFEGTYIIKQIGKVKFGIIGIMTEELPRLSLPANLKNLEVRSAASTIHYLVPELKKQGANVIIALTHVGVDEDSVLAAKCPELDIIIGGHSHTALFHAKDVNGVVIAQAGSRGRWLGKLNISVDTKKDTVLTYKEELIETRAADVTPDPVVAEKVDALEKLADKGLSEVIGELKTDWKRGGGGESNMGDWIADAMKWYAKTDIAFQNSGGIRKDVLAGPLTIRDIWEISPFGNTLVTFSVDGKTFLSMLNHQLKMRDDFCQISGFTVVYSLKPNDEKVVTVSVDGKPLDEKKIYTVVTNNYVAAQSKKYFGIELNDSQIHELNVIDRDAFIDAVKEQKVISTSLDGRITVEKE
jgi:2',3'-cyclic-nucleotide 2'-phosphodiesterase (5'-nucleotidase family)